MGVSDGMKGPPGKRCVNTEKFSVSGKAFSQRRLKTWPFEIIGDNPTKIINFGRVFRLSF
ncbi:hypothetical protein CFR74_14455 [Novacetimonas hansenii]|nr:hypothetical protein CFR74_14455 [Novacetimonas hansenii]